MTLGNILTWIIVGGIAGFLADWVIKGIRLGMIGKVIIGILGGFVGGWLFNLLKISISAGFWGRVISAFVGAVILLILLRVLRRKKTV